jgi:Methyl-accepting chemotaxis protein
MKKMRARKVTTRIKISYAVFAVLLLLTSGIGISGLSGSASGSSTAQMTALAAICAVGIIFAVLSGRSLVKNITRPIKDLADAAGEFAQGKVNVQIDFQSGTEMGQLAESLRSGFRSLNTVIHELSSILTRMSEGDLSVADLREYRGDFASIPKAVNTILFKLNEDFNLISQTAEQVDSGSAQVATGAQGLAQGASEQASSIEELSASIADVAHKIRENNEYVATVTVSINDAATDVDSSNQKMQQLLGAMDGISEASNEINKINQVIDNIAFQTNILALNAAVEAARAGEAGKGFAVVADEVRNLAGKSAEAAKQTKQLIENSLQKVGDGAKMADGTAQELEKATTQMKIIAETIQKIEAASSTQALAVEQINQGIEQVSAVVQTNSATAEESAAASEELSSQTSMMMHHLSRIKLRSAKKNS